MRQAKRDPLLTALERVIHENGMATWPVRAWVETRRGVRTVLLAMLEQSATDETACPYDFRTPKTGGVRKLAQALEGVVFDIHHALDENASFFTLTEAGVKKLISFGANL